MKRTKICDFVEWELEKFRKECNFTDDELTYFNLRAKNKTHIEIAMKMNCSVSNVDKISKRVRKKMIKVI